MKLEAREIESTDIPLIINYWLNATPDHLRGMGADPAKIPHKADFFSALQRQISTPYRKKESFSTIWLKDGVQIGHCNMNKIKFGDSANMHLHLWHPEDRQKGMGSMLIKSSLNIFFDKFNLDWIYCEPYALNPAPNKTLEKFGFEFEKTYTTVPGSINFEQPVKRWIMTRQKFQNLC